MVEADRFITIGDPNDDSDNGIIQSLPGKGFLLSTYLGSPENNTIIIGLPKGNLGLDDGVDSYDEMGKC